MAGFHRLDLVVHGVGCDGTCVEVILAFFENIFGTLVESDSDFV